MQADVGRLLILSCFGGFWIDLKLKPLKPVLLTLVNDDLVLIEHYAKPDLPDPSGHISNSFIGAAPGHPLLDAALDAIADNVNARMAGSIYCVTSATNIMNALKQPIAWGSYKLLRHFEAWDVLSKLGRGSYNKGEMHWTQRQGRGENPFN